MNTLSSSTMLKHKRNMTPFLPLSNLPTEKIRFKSIKRKLQNTEDTGFQNTQILVMTYKHHKHLAKGEYNGYIKKEQ